MGEPEIFDKEHITMPKVKYLNGKELSDAALRMALLADAGAGNQAIAATGLNDEDLTDLPKGDLDEILAETGRFPKYFTDLLGVGLETGKLPDCLRSLHDYYLRDHRLKQSIRQALYQPLAMLAISILIFLVILIKIFPVFQTAYQAAGMAVGPAMSFFLAWGQDMTRRPWLYLGALAGLIVLLTVLLQSGWLQIRLQTSKTGRSVRNARLVQALSMGLDSGMETDRALAMAQDVSEIKLANAGDHTIQTGALLYDSYVISKPDRWILEAGETSGNLPDAMAYVAASMMDDANNNIKKLSARIEPAITLLGAALSGGVILTSMLPLLDVMSSIG